MFEIESCTFWSPPARPPILCRDPLVPRPLCLPSCLSHIRGSWEGSGPPDGPGSPPSSRREAESPHFYLFQPFCCVRSWTHRLLPLGQALWGLNSPAAFTGWSYWFLGHGAGRGPEVSVSPRKGFVNLRP